jgi:hypothetical protein
LAGVVVQTKQVERISGQLGQQVEAFCQREREAIRSGKVTPLVPAVPILYIALDGTGEACQFRNQQAKRWSSWRPWFYLRLFAYSFFWSFERA